MRAPVELAPVSLEEIRVNIAFEKMVASVLAGAAFGGVATFICRLITMAPGGFAPGEMLGAVMELLLVSFMIFLTGFFASVAIGGPLFKSLEKRKVRNVWPYLAASLVVAIVAFALSNEGFITRGGMTLFAVTATFAPAVFVAVMFSKLMTPHWRAAEKAEREAENDQTRTGANIVRLH